MIALKQFSIPVFCYHPYLVYLLFADLPIIYSCYVLLILSRRVWFQCEQGIPTLSNYTYVLTFCNKFGTAKLRPLSVLYWNCIFANRGNNKLIRLQN